MMKTISQEMNDEASDYFPSVDLEAGASLHLYQQGRVWNVWLNLHGCQDFTGLCLSAEPTRDEALRQAVRVLEGALEQLQAPASAWPSTGDAHSGTPWNKDAHLGAVEEPV